jgi:hypothetical protein
MSTMTVSQVPTTELTKSIKDKADEGIGIVEVMDDGRRTHVVLRDDVYRRLTGPSLRESLAMPEGDDIDLELPSRKG